MADNSPNPESLYQYADLSRRALRTDKQGRIVTKDGAIVGDNGLVDYSQSSGDGSFLGRTLPEITEVKRLLGTKKGRKDATDMAIGAFGGKIVEGAGKVGGKAVSGSAKFVGQHSDDAASLIGKSKPMVEKASRDAAKKGLNRVRNRGNSDLSKEIDSDALKRGEITPSSPGEPGKDIELAQKGEIERQRNQNDELERRGAVSNDDAPESPPEEKPDKGIYYKPDRGKEAAKNAFRRHGKNDHRRIVERTGDALRDGTGIDPGSALGAIPVYGWMAQGAYNLFNTAQRNRQAFNQKLSDRRKKATKISAIAIVALLGLGYLVGITTVTTTAPAAANQICLPDPDNPSDRPDGSDSDNSGDGGGSGDDGDHSKGAGTSAEGLNQHQKDTAVVIMAMGKALKISEYGQIIAVMTSMQESQLGAAAGSNKPNGDGDAGPFQQRQLPGWYGTLEEVTNTAYASKVFYQGKNVTEGGGAGPKGYHIPGLLDIDGWEKMQAADAAQKVQRSAFPDAYAKWEPLARDLYRKLGGKDDLIPDEYREAIEDPSILDNGVDDSPEPPDEPGEGGGDGDDNTNNPISCGPDAKEKGGGGDGKSCPSRASKEVEAAMEGVKPDTLAVARCAWGQNKKLNSMGGVGSRPNKSDHGSGRAVDIMIPDWKKTPKTGDDMATYLMNCASDLGITYIIWDVRIWNAERGEKPKDVKKWRDYTHPNGNSNPTVRHEDHVHVSVKGNAGTGKCGSDDGGGGDGKWTNPVSKGKYALTSPFGYRTHPITGARKMHAGQDMGARPRGTNPAIHSATSGKVTFAGVQGGYGNTVVVDIGKGTEIYYPHLSEIGVKVGDKLKAGDDIGKMGTTGASTGVHLHFEIRVKGEPTDPVPYMSKRGVKL